jgi:hypothetical protein
MSKIFSHDSFGCFKHKLWPKERPGVKLTIWLPTIKSQESTRFPCVQVACHIPLESFWQGYNFALNLIPIRGLHRKLWGSKVVRVSTLGISRLPFGSPETKCHLDVGLVERHKVYYKGEGGASPKSRLWWVLWVWVCPWCVLAPKVLKLCTNQLVVWFE